MKVDEEGGGAGGVPCRGDVTTVVVLLFYASSGCKMATRAPAGVRGRSQGHGMVYDEEEVMRRSRTGGGRID